MLLFARKLSYFRGWWHVPILIRLIKGGGGRDHTRRIPECACECLGGGILHPAVKNKTKPKKKPRAETDKSEKNGRWELPRSREDENQVAAGAGRCGGGAGGVITAGAEPGEEREGNRKLLMI